MSKHTKGPWRRSGNIIWGAEIQSKVAKVYSPYIPGEPSTSDTERYNAKLIASAPELLEACKVILVLSETTKELTGFQGLLKPFFDVALKAIDKAEGNES